ncbi:hypothetical protein [Thermoflexibacter ruber]|nr:hypothetical protein [Thermoflexibacter ruber]
MRSFTKAKLFFVLLFSIIFTLLSIFNVPSNRNILAKEAAESEKEECKSESENNGELYNIFGLKKAKLGKKSPPPDISFIYDAILPNNSLVPFFSIYTCIAKIEAVTTCYYNIFNHTPRYIVFHALIFYEV